MKLKAIFIFTFLLCAVKSKAEFKLSYSDTLMYLGTRLYKELNLIHAKEKLDSCILLNPMNDECKYYRAKIEFDMKSYQKASIMFKNVLALKEEDASSWHMLGLCFTNMKYYDSAEFCFKNAIRLNSKRSDFFANWANNQFLRGSLNHAEELYSTAILLEDKNPKFYANRAEVREQLGDKAKAAEDLQTALNLDPSNEKIKSKINESQGLTLIRVFAVIAFTLAIFMAIWIRYRRKKV
jgi:tetratricopeptide (TPR) repeat protein